MGGRGSALGGGVGSSGAVKVVPYDKWKEQETKEIYATIDGEKVRVGQEEDVDRWENKPYTEPISKAAILQLVDDERLDNGYYGDNDVMILFAYSDGTVVNADDLNGKKYKKSGLVGVSISTGDYEAVWGGEYSYNPRNYGFHEWQTYSEDGESGATNSYASYRTTAHWKERVRVTYMPDEKGRARRKTEVLKRSTKQYYKYDKKGRRIEDK